MNYDHYINFYLLLIYSEEDIPKWFKQILKLDPKLFDQFLELNRHLLYK